MAWEPFDDFDRYYKERADVQVGGVLLREVGGGGRVQQSAAAAAAASPSAKEPASDDESVIDMVSPPPKSRTSKRQTTPTTVSPADVMKGVMESFFTHMQASEANFLNMMSKLVQSAPPSGSSMPPLEQPQHQPIARQSSVMDMDWDTPQTHQLTATVRPEPLNFPAPSARRGLQLGDLPLSPPSIFDSAVAAAFAVPEPAAIDLITPPSSQ